MNPIIKELTRRPGEAGRDLLQGRRRRPRTPRAAKATRNASSFSPAVVIARKGTGSTRRSPSAASATRGCRAACSRSTRRTSRSRGRARVRERQGRLYYLRSRSGKAAMAVKEKRYEDAQGLIPPPPRQFKRAFSGSLFYWPQTGGWGTCVGAINPRVRTPRLHQAIGLFLAAWRGDVRRAVAAHRFGGGLRANILGTISIKSGVLCN